MCYRLIRPLLFLLPAEFAHHMVLTLLTWAYRLKLLKPYHQSFSKPIHVMGLNFPNRLGLAAGFDRDAKYIDGLSALGFGFIEIGTVTVKPQEGKPKPRLFRLIKQESLINRMGFPSKGVDYVVQKLKKTKYKGILGISIGKNKDIPNDKALDDYLILFQRLWRYASYIAINISSPNTEKLRDLQEVDYLKPLLMALKREQKNIAYTYQRYVPLVVKISPDLTSKKINQIADLLLELKIDGVIATNTTISREGVVREKYAREHGGLSGRPLLQKSTLALQILHARCKGKIPIIGCGGIMDHSSAHEKLKHGASLLQVYTGFIYHGPRWVQELMRGTTMV